MCYFITIAVRQADAEAACGKVPRGFAMAPVANASVLSALPAGYETFLLVSGGCSCGLYQSEPTPPARPHNPEHLRRKYERKGWARARIERALGQSLAARSEPGGFLGFRDDVVEILQSISATTDRFALLVHWYDEGLEDERIVLGTPQRTTPDRLADVVPERDRLLWVGGE